ncbi:elongase of fatty acids ELO [Clavulina sp. PMI_390]|nr:elongase of fatty acids ELO [Clavulina sp. PMI_390]
MAPLADALLTVLPTDILPEYLTTYIPGTTPLSETPVVVSVLAGYLATIFSIQWLMKDKQALKLTFLFQLHNLFLTSISGLLLVLILEETLPIWWNKGFFNAICHPRSWTPRLEFYYMINYYIKYVELIDTVFLAAKKKPLAFLHVFHHSATALLCYTQLNGKTAVSWIVISLNLLVHVVMYYYYYATAGGAKIWWKKYLTSMQITQFVIDLGVVYFARTSFIMWQRLVFRGYVPNWIFFDNCAGSEPAAYFGAGLLTSYLFLFIDFYIRTYKGGAAKKGGAKKTKAE